MRLVFFLFFCSVFFSKQGITQDASSCFDKGKEFYSVGNYSSALESFKKAKLTDPWIKDLNYYAGMSAYNLQEYTAAIPFFDDELKNYKNLKAFVFRAKAKGEIGLYRPALKDFRKAKRIDRQNILVYLERGNLKLSQKKYKKAIHDFRKALKIRPGVEIAYYKIGFCKFYLKDTVAACQNWSKIAEIDDFKDHEMIEELCKSIDKLKK